MNSYEPETPRATFGIAAAALTAITIGLFVVAPAKFDARSDEALILAAAKAGYTAPVEVAIIPARIEVVGARETNVVSNGVSNVAWALAGDSKPNCKPES